MFKYFVYILLLKCCAVSASTSEGTLQQSVPVQRLRIVLEAQFRLSELKAQLVSQGEQRTDCWNHQENVVQITVPGMNSFSVLCDNCAAGPDWIVVQRRVNGSVDFYRDWQAYRNGFGSFDGEFFLGLEKIYWLTKSRPYELYVELVDFANQKFYAHYDNFLIGSEQEKYMLKSLGNYSGNAGDALTYNLYDKFTTIDSDNDKWDKGNAAVWYKGGGWFNLHGNR